MDGKMLKFISALVRLMFIFRHRPADKISSKSVSQHGREISGQPTCLGISGGKAL